VPIRCDGVTTPLHISYPFLSQNRQATVLTTITRGAAELPNKVLEKFKALLERDKVEFSPSGVGVSPPLASGSGSARDGGSQNANDGSR
jgi:hypothetical protein